MSIIAGIEGQILEVTVVGCQKLKDTKWFSNQDPYIVLEYSGTKHRTGGGKNVVLQEKFMLTLIEGLRDLKVAVWKSHTFSADDLIGKATIQLQKVLSQGYDDCTCILQTKTGKLAGEVRLILHYAEAHKHKSAPYSASPYSSSSAYPPASAYPPPPPPCSTYPPPPYPPPQSPYPPNSAYPPAPSAYPPPPPPSSTYPPPPYPPPPSPYPPTSAYPPNPLAYPPPPPPCSTYPPQQSTYYYPQIQYSQEQSVYRPASAYPHQAAAYPPPSTSAYPPAPSAPPYPPQSSPCYYPQVI